MECLKQSFSIYITFLRLYEDNYKKTIETKILVICDTVWILEAEIHLCVLTA